MASTKVWLIRGVGAFAVAILAATLSPKVREVEAVNLCLDAGGSFDFAAQSCRFSGPSAAYTPGNIFQLPDATATRHGKVAGLLVLVAFLGWDVRRRRMPPAADRGASGVTTQPG